MNLSYCALKPTWVLNNSSRCLSSATRSHHADHRASSKLFTDAKHEEVTPSRSNLLRTAPKHANWTGDESIEDAVLRMLVDKYKPLRTGTVQTAEEKLRRAPPIVNAQPPAILSISDTPATTSSPSPPPSSVHRANEPILPPVEGHKPWLTTFKVPSHASVSIRYGEFPTAPTPTPTTSADPSQSVRATEQADDLARPQRP
jgi:DnaJ family protein C protein 28